MNKIVLIRTEKYQEKSRFGLLIQDNQLYLVVGQNAGLSKSQTSLLFLLGDKSSTMNCSSALSISDEIISDEYENALKSLFFQWASGQEKCEVSHLAHATKVAIDRIHFLLERNFKRSINLSRHQYCLTLECASGTIFL